MSVVFPVTPSPRFQISTASDGQTDFPVNFPFQANADVVVAKVVDDVETVLDEGEDYTLTGAGEPTGGTLTLIEPAEAGWQIVRYGSVVLERLSDVTQGGKYSSKQTDAELDRIILALQEVQRDLDRALKAKLGSSGGVVVAGAEGALAKFTADGGLEAGPSAADLDGLADAAASAEADAATASAAAGTATAAAASAATDASTASSSAASASTSAANALSDRVLAQAARAAADADAAATAVDATNTSSDAASAASDRAAAESARDDAQGARDAALAAFDNFDDKYLGAKASDPTLDNDGNALADGAIYWNTTAKNWRAYDLATTSWNALAIGSVASAIASTPAGNLSSTNVQDALNELDSEKLAASALDTDGTLAANSDAKIASQKAVRTFVNAAIAGVLNGVSTAYDTLAEIAAALVLKLAGSTGAADNALLRADGTGGLTVQATGITVDDSNNVTGVAGLTAAGLVDLSGAAAGQVKFPGTQNPSSDVNTLDDYEEGTWTPVLNFGHAATGITYGSPTTGRYTKIGRLVIASFVVTLTSKGTATGNAQIVNLPFATPNDLIFGGAQIGWTTGFTSVTGSLTSMVQPNGTSANFYQTVNGAASLLTNANFSNTSSFYATLVYDAAA